MEKKKTSEKVGYWEVWRVRTRERKKFENVLESESNTKRLVFQMSELAEKFVGFSITCKIFCCHEKLYLNSVFFFLYII